MFGISKKPENKEVKAKAVVKVPAKKSVATINVAFSHTEVIVRPHITEKSGLLSQTGVYTFQVRPTANKDSVAKAVRALYKVTPVKISMTNLPAKNVIMRGKRGVVAGLRKAVVTVKKGEKIDFV